MPLRATLLLLLLCRVADAHPLAGRHVRFVWVRGNQAFGNDEIVTGLATHPPAGLFIQERSRLDPVAVEQDRRRIEAFYAARGYFGARVTGVTAHPARGEEVDVVFTLIEGEPTRIERIEVEGADVPARGLAVGDVFVHARYLEARRRIEHDLVSAGYAHAVVSGEVEVDRTARRARVHFAVDPGPPAVFGKVEIAGQTRVPSSAILSRVAFENGERFDPDSLELTQSRLNELGTFSSVILEVDHRNRPREVDVTVRVGDALRHELRAGGGVAYDETRFEARLRGGYSQRTAFDPLLRLFVEARPGYTIYDGDQLDDGFTVEARAGLERHDFALPRLRLLAEGTYSIDVFDGYTTQGPSARLGLDRRLARDRLRLGAGWQLRFLTIDGEADVDSDDYRLGFFEQSVAYDLRDDPLDAHRGVYARIAFEEGGAFAGGKLPYLRVAPELRAYLGLGGRVVLAALGRGGWLSSSGDEEPITQLFYGGGASGHRGYGFRDLKPDPDSALGGNALLETSFEARFDVTRFRGALIGLTAFVDGGDVTHQLDDIALDDLAWATGLGLRYHTPLGPVRFDLAFLLNRGDGSEPHVHFSLGETF